MDIRIGASRYGSRGHGAHGCRGGRCAAVSARDDALAEGYDPDRIRLAVFGGRVIDDSEHVDTIDDLRRSDQWRTLDERHDDERNLYYLTRGRGL